MTLPMLPIVLSCNVAADEAVYRLAVPEDLPAFQGHFPGRPILPGVVQIDWVAQLAAKSWGLPSVARVFQVKFRNIISPGNALTLTLRFDRARGRVHFEYTSDESIMSAGRIALEPLA